MYKTHNMTRDCSLNSPKNTSSQHVVYKNCFFVIVLTCCNLVFFGEFKENLSSYCDSSMRTSEKDLHVLFTTCLSRENMHYELLLVTFLMK